MLGKELQMFTKEEIECIYELLQKEQYWLQSCITISKTGLIGTCDTNKESIPKLEKRIEFIKNIIRKVVLM